ncbi:hypothetical protein HZA75_06630 [Candidatus Roizmanbacteria bacterium]|nr:hypothetical protein [Candidatus Roizmanbacteria bacterium]
MKVIDKNNLLIILLLLIISIFSILPLFQHGFFVTDDGEWMIIRFSAFFQAVKDGQLPVRFLQQLNFGYGYPVPTFLYPGFMYFGTLIHIFKIGFVDTIKVVLGLSLVGAAIFVYFWLEKVFKDRIGAVVGAAASFYVPYHLYDVYTRGSVGEVFAFTWVAFILWMIERKNIFLISVGIFLLIIAHNTMALLFLPLLFIYALLRKVLQLKQLIFCFILGVLLSSFFIIPAVFELPFTQFSQTTIANPVNYFVKYSLIGHGVSFIFLVSILLFFFKRKQAGENPLVILFLIITFLAAFLSTSWSTFIWKIIPSSFIQFPFRFLSYLIITVAFLAAFIVSKMKDKFKKIALTAAILILLLISAYPYGSPKDFTDKGEGFYFTNEATTTVRDEYLPVWAKQKHTQRAANKVEIIKGEGVVQDIVYNNKKIVFTLNAEDNVRVKINTIYWPGWKVFVDNNEVSVSSNNQEGIMEFGAGKGIHQISVRFSETPLRIFSDIVSLLTFIILVFIVVRKKTKL